MFGLVLNVTATYVVLFVVFGALMNRFGAGDFFVRLPFALTAGFRGGPAKAAVLGSGMMGMISGSATANTRSEEHTSELQSLMSISYAVFCWKKKKKEKDERTTPNNCTTQAQ